MKTEKVEIFSIGNKFLLGHIRIKKEEKNRYNILIEIPLNLPKKQVMEIVKSI